MGRRGPAPHPDKLVERKYGFLKHRSGTDQVQAPQGVPKCPNFVHRSARRWWKEISAQLAELGLLSEMDRVPLALLCESIHAYLRAQRTCDAHFRKHQSLEVTTDNGATLSIPAVRQRDQAWNQVLKMSREFGLTPSARSGIRAAPTKQKDGDAGSSRFFNVLA